MYKYQFLIIAKLDENIIGVTLIKKLLFIMHIKLLYTNVQDLPRKQEMFWNIPATLQQRCNVAAMLLECFKIFLAYWVIITRYKKALEVHTY